MSFVECAAAVGSADSTHKGGNYGRACSNHDARHLGVGRGADDASTTVVYLFVQQINCVL